MTENKDIAGNTKKFVIHLAGPPASGKSTLARLIAERFPGTYRIFYDELKWQLSGYERDHHRTLITNIELGLFHVVCGEGVPVVFELFFETEEKYRETRAMAEERGYTWITVELIASEEVLAGRFRERLSDGLSAGAQMTLTTEAAFRENLKHRPYLPAERLSIDTGQASVEENVHKILAYLASLDIFPR